MNTLISATDNKTMSSREIAELTGKEHKNVVRDVRAMFIELDLDVLTFERIYYDQYQRIQKEIMLDKELTTTLITGYSIKLRNAVIKRWQELETAQQFTIPSNLSEALRLAADNIEARDYKMFTDLVVGALDTECGFQKQIHQSINAGHLVVVHGTQDPCTSENTAFALGRNSGQENVIALAGNTIDRQPTNGGNGNGFDEQGVMYTLTRTDVHAVNTGMRVRRLTPTECERLQGFPDGYTNVPFKGKPAADAHRYKALGNSMAVPCMRWLGVRIDSALRLAMRGAA